MLDYRGIKILGKLVENGSFSFNSGLEKNDFGKKEQLPDSYFKEHCDVIEELIKNNLVEYYIQKFENYFYKKGFDRKKELLLTGIDNTILFTNSAIVSLKDYIKNGIEISSYFITQSCIRVQNLEYELNEEIKYISSFNMIGVFIDKKNYTDFIKDVWEFLQKELGYNKEDIKIFCDENHRSLIKGWKELSGGPEIIYSEENFDWKFGEGEMMKGHGFDFRVLNKNGEYTDIGNIMEVISYGEIKGYGLGLGVETLVSHKNGYKNPIEFFTKKGGIEIYDNIEIHLYDTLKLLIDSYKKGIKSGPRGANYEIKKAFKKINKILLKNPNLFLELKNNIYLLGEVCQSEKNIIEEIYNEILKKADFEISNKSLSLLVDKKVNVNILLNELKDIFPNIKFGFKDEYIGDNIGSNNKSLTFQLTYVSKKGLSKDTFKLIIEELKKNYTIR